MLTFEDFIAAFYATVTAMREGGIKEAELKHHFEDDEGRESRFTVVLRSEVADRRMILREQDD